MAKRRLDGDRGRDYSEVTFARTITDDEMAKLQKQWNRMNQRLGEALDSMMKGDGVPPGLQRDYKKQFPGLALFWRERLRMLHNALRGSTDAAPSQVRRQSPLQEEGGVRDLLGFAVLDAMYVLAMNDSPFLSENKDRNFRAGFTIRALTVEWALQRVLGRDRDDFMIMYGRASDGMNWVPVGFSETKIQEVQGRRCKIQMPEGGGTREVETRTALVGNIPGMVSLAKAFGVHINGLGAAWLFDAAFDRFKARGCTYAVIIPAHGYLERVYGRYGFKARDAVDVNAFATVMALGGSVDEVGPWEYPDDMIELVRTVRDYENMTKGVSKRARVGCRFCQSRFDMMEF